MLRFPTWAWRPARFGKPSGPQALSAAPSRPCLPAVEKLDGRVLLSTSSSDSVRITFPDLAGNLLQDQANLAESEAAALDTIPAPAHKHLAGIKYEEVAQLGDAFAKMDEALLDFEGDILQQKVTPTEQTDLSLKLGDIFGKIYSLAADLDPGTDGLLLPAVQKVRMAALGAEGDGSVFIGGVVGDLSKLQLSGLVSTLSTDDRMHYLKIGTEFQKVDEALIDQKVDVIMGAPMDDQVKITLQKVDEAFAKLNLEDSLVSSANQLSGGLLTGLQGEIDGVISGATTSPG